MKAYPLLKALKARITNRFLHKSNVFLRLKALGLPELMGGGGGGGGGGLIHGVTQVLRKR